MSAFSDKKFNAADYNKFRPNYPPSLYAELMKYHNGSSEVLLDVGCGPGEAFIPLLGQFKKIIATDISEVMVENVKSNVTDPSVEAYVSSSENLSEILPQGNQVDLVVAAECCHWMDESKFLNEMARVLKDNGTLSYWGYVDPVFVDSPRANEIFEEFVYEKGSLLGPYWQQPGRNKLRNLFPEMNNMLLKDKRFTDVEIHLNNPSDAKLHNQKTPLLLEKEYTVEDYINYGRTWSSAHNWAKAHPGEPPIIEKFYHRLNKELGWTMDTKVRMSYKTVFTLARRVIR